MTQRSQQIENLLDDLSDYMHNNDSKSLTEILEEFGFPSDEELESALLQRNPRLRSTEKES